MRERVQLIKNMQIWGVVSLFLCVLCMFLIFADNQLLGKGVFGLGLLLLLVSLGISIREIQISVKALNLRLKNMDKQD